MARETKWIARMGGDPMHKAARLWTLVCLVGLSTAAPAQASTVYLCKAYSGGMFWSSTHCQDHKALIDRMVNVPDGLPWDQQVRLAEDNRADAARLTAPPPATVTTTERTFHNGVEGKAGECQALAATIRQYDAMARQALSGPTQDRVTAERRRARDRQFQLRC